MLPLGLNAQSEAKDSLVSKVVAVSDSSYVQLVTTDSLQHKIVELLNQVHKLESSENTLNGKIYDYDKKLKSQEARIKLLEHKLIFADSIIARLSNDCLRKKYDQIPVSDAIRNFDQMYSPELRSKFGKLRILLSSYRDYYQEIVAIFNEAQSDTDILNPFTGQKKALMYIDKIKSTRYYTEIYDADWTIPYLNNLIDKSIETIQKFNPKEKKTIQLLQLIK